MLFCHVAHTARTSDKNDIAKNANLSNNGARTMIFGSLGGRQVGEYNSTDNINICNAVCISH